MGTEVAMSGGGSGLFRDVLEGSFPELYAAPEEAEPEALPLEGEGGGDGGDAAPPPAEEGAGKDAEDGEGVEGEGGEGGCNGWRRIGVGAVVRLRLGREFEGAGDSAHFCGGLLRWRQTIHSSGRASAYW